MNEMIVRISGNKYDVEVAYKEDESLPIFKKIGREKFLQILNSSFSVEAHYQKDLKLIDPSILAIDEHYVLVNQPEHKKIVTYSPDNNKAKTYRISFPNSFYIIEKRKDNIKSIECYSYKQFKGEKTELYEYPMPNELSGNMMCIGTADRKITDDDIVATLERIIFTPYSHDRFSGMNGFSRTETYFEYLEKNEFPYKLMKPLKKILKDVLHD